MDRRLDAPAPKQQVRTDDEGQQRATPPLPQLGNTTSMGALSVDPTAAPAVGIAPGGADFDGVAESFAVASPTTGQEPGPPGDGTAPSQVATETAAAESATGTDSGGAAGDRRNAIDPAEAQARILAFAQQFLASGRGSIQEGHGVVDRLAGAAQQRVGRRGMELTRGLYDDFAFGGESVDGFFDLGHATLEAEQAAIVARATRATEQAASAVSASVGTQSGALHGTLSDGETAFASAIEEARTAAASLAQEGQGAIDASATDILSAYSGEDLEAATEAVDEVKGDANGGIAAEGEQVAADIASAPPIADGRWRAEVGTAQEHLDDVATTAQEAFRDGGAAAEHAIGEVGDEAGAFLDGSRQAAHGRLDQAAMEAVAGAEAAVQEARAGIEATATAQHQEVDQAMEAFAAEVDTLQADLVARAHEEPSNRFDGDTFDQGLVDAGAPALQSLEQGLAEQQANAGEAWTEQGDAFDAEADATEHDAQRAIQEGLTGAEAHVQDTTGAVVDGLEEGVVQVEDQVAEGRRQVDGALTGVVSDFGDALDHGRGDGERGLDEGLDGMQTQVSGTVRDSQTAMSEAAHEATKTGLAALWSSLGGWLSDIGSMLWEVAKAIGSALEWIGKQLVNLVWGAIWGETAFDDVWGGDFVAFVGDVLAGLVFYGDIRDIIKYFVVHPLMGKGPWWLNLILGIVAIVGLIPFYGDIFKGLVKGGKWITKLFMKAGSRVVKELGGELGEKLIKELGEAAAEELLDKLGKEVLERLGKDLSGEAIQKLVDELGEEVVKKLAADLSGEAIQKLAADLGPDVLRKLADDLPGEAIQKLADDLGPDVVKKLAADLSGDLMQKLVQELGAEVVKKLAAELTGQAILKLLLDLGADVLKKLAADLGGHAIQRLATDLGADALKKLAAELGGEAIQKLVDDLGADVVKKLSADLGGQALEKLATDLGADALKELAADLSGTAIQKLVDDLGADVVKKLAADLTGPAIEKLVADLGEDVVKKLAADLGGDAIQKLVDDLGADIVKELASEMTGEAIEKMVKDYGAHVVKTLTPKLGGKGMKELIELRMFKFDPAKQALLDSGKGAASRGMGELAGKSVADVQQELGAAGFTHAATHNGMEIWTHADGSIARVKVAAPAIPDAVGRMESVVLEISSVAGDWSKKKVFAKVAENGAVVPQGKKFAAESMKQWFKKKVGQLPDPNELAALMDVWGKSGHIPLTP